jgi:glucose 1-dehydrogenase
MSETMRAVVKPAGTEKEAELREMERPRPDWGQVLVRVLEAGIDGTDREIYEGEYGDFPPGDDHMVMGHEVVGEVTDVGDGVCGVEAGDLVVPTVRRPCPQYCVTCRNGQVDFCSTGDHREHGIKELHGFFREYFTESYPYLVRLPAEQKGDGVMVEPISILEKSFRMIDVIQRRVHWEPRRLLITGAGNMGLLAAFIGALRGLDILVYSRGENTGARNTILDALGAGYQDAEKEELEETTERWGRPDIFIEGTGFSPLSWQGTRVLAENGIGCLLGVTPGGETHEVESDELNQSLVMGNRVVFGSVNAARRDFETGIDSLRQIRERWPEALDAFITKRISLDDVPDYLGEKDHEEVKTLVEVG